MRVVKPICTEGIVPHIGIIDAVSKLPVTLVEQVVVVAVGGITLVVGIAAPVESVPRAVGGRHQ